MIRTIIRRTSLPPGFRVDQRAGRSPALRAVSRLSTISVSGDIRHAVWVQYLGLGGKALGPTKVRLCVGCDDVDDLKKAAKAEFAPALDHIPAAELIVSTSMDNASLDVGASVFELDAGKKSSVPLILRLPGGGYLAAAPPVRGPSSQEPDIEQEAQDGQTTYTLTTAGALDPRTLQRACGVLADSERGRRTRKT